LGILSLTHATILQSLDGARVYFLDELCLQLVERDVASLECLSQCAVLLTLGEVILVEASSVCLELASGRTLSEQIVVAVLNLLIGLAGRTIDEIGPERDVATDKPKVVVAPNETSVEGEAC
jgi:hypothetical protein